MRSEYLLILIEDDFIYIEDTCLYTQKMSVTNDAENVVADIHKKYSLIGRSLYYLDTDGNVDILLHKDGVFTNFAPGYKNYVEFRREVVDGK